MLLLERLKAWIQAECADGVAVAFSGGIDSTTLLAALTVCRQEQPFPLLVLTYASPFQPHDETAQAQQEALRLGAPAQVISGNPLEDAVLADNPPDRCYYCKRRIFGTFLSVAAGKGIRLLVEGTHADDLGVYRPGRRALQELGVRSPFAELGIHKADIRLLAQALGVPNAGRPSTPCLATRFPYRTCLTAEALRQVEQGEAAFRRILPQVNFRVRVHGDLARLEVPPEAFERVLACRGEILEALHAVGFNHVALDLQGFRSGSFDVGSIIGRVME